MNELLLYFGIFFLITNIIAFFVMWIDKGKAQKKGRQRISEGMIFFIATMFGSVGVYIGMFAFRHKIKKWYFVIGIPFLFLQNIAFLYVIYKLYIELISF
jgi:uncharacterized membrane protein YsdA (DUF1294 family)